MLSQTVAAIAFAALVLWIRGALLTVDGSRLLWMLAPSYLFGISAGMRLYGLIDERRFRRVALVFPVIVSTVTLAA